MSPTRLRECMAALGWSQRQLAAILGVHETRTRRWATGRYGIPENVADWLETLAAAHMEHSTPQVRQSDDAKTAVETPSEIADARRAVRDIFREALIEAIAIAPLEVVAEEQKLSSDYVRGRMTRRGGSLIE